MAAVHVAAFIHSVLRTPHSALRISAFQRFSVLVCSPHWLHSPLRFRSASLPPWTAATTALSGFRFDSLAAQPPRRYPRVPPVHVARPTRSIPLSGFVNSFSDFDSLIAHSAFLISAFQRFSFSAFYPVPSTIRALGIDFFNGSAEEAVAWVCQHGGLVVAPAGPSFIALQNDPAYRAAIADADLAIADSGWMVNFWQLLRHERITRISGLKFFKCLLETSDAREPGHLFWILPSQTARTTTLAWAREHQYPLTADDLYVAPDYRSQPPARSSHSDPSLSQDPGTVPTFAMEDARLVDLIRARRPKHIVVAIGGGMQDKVGSYLKHHCGYRPGIYCIGAAPGFVTGDQVKIPMWADRFFVGWIFRVLAQPRTFIPRFWSARRLPALIRRYGREMPEAK